ncbi:AAA family ATPase [Neorhodopirellula pilleata]|uniref:CobQ/CobB/MinD/ParA nucleotide binding domain protein n=1 Tax=Neorhodopirellula pilleata TaxID=2714738 RepID=A0A5C6AGZ0_9BACT|nr:AAA family ATPase [Neorhodopirellula pilleata]TWT98879.1 CobQ/CobB/MinD/ParA nucleotide binding domain protein [Neorhodopirellula pilleata]
MPDLTNAGDFTMQTYESLRTEAESLRQRVGQENVNQSSVLASRRLDEALLRLDLAAGRRRDRTSSLTSARVSVERETRTTNHETIQPRLAPSRTSDLELDESIQQSSAMWFEANDEERTQYRFEEPASEIKPPTSRLRNAASHSDAGLSEAGLSKVNPSEAERKQPPSNSDLAAKANVPVPAPEHSVSMLDATTPDSWAMLFSSPIDVMISAPHELRHETPVDVAPAEEKVTETAPIEIPSHGSASIEQAPQLEAATADTSFDESTSTDLETSRSAQDEPEGSGEQTGSSCELESFQATWQVDEFVVPSVVDELFLGGSIAEQLASRLAAARQDGLRTIAVTSAKSGEGRSTVAMGMALSVAFSGLKVAIVDADPEGVRLATDLHLDLDHSWLDCVRHQLPLEEAAVHSDADSLTLIPMLGRDNEPTMDYTDLRLLLRKLKTCFDLVVVDCGVSAFAEVGLCDTALIVRDVHRTKAHEVETLARSLRRSGVQGVGVIENYCQG